MRDPYAILGVPRDAGEEAIRRAYAVRLAAARKRLAEGRPISKERFEAMREAYETLLEAASPASDRQPSAAAPRPIRQRRWTQPAFLAGLLVLAAALVLILAVLASPFAAIRVATRWPASVLFAVPIALLAGLASSVAWLWQFATDASRGKRLALRAATIVAAAACLVPLPPYAKQASDAVDVIGDEREAPTTRFCAELADRAPSNAAKLALLARCGGAESVGELLDRGAAIDDFVAYGRFDPVRTPLMHAVSENRTRTVRLLLARGADPRARREPNDETALHIAAGKGHCASAALLLANGAEVDAVHALGTPLHAAVVQGSLKCVELLLAAGADPNHRIAGSGDAPLHRLGVIAQVRADHAAIARALERAGASYAVRNRMGRTPIEAMRRELVEALFDGGTRLPAGAPPSDGWWVALRANDPLAGVERLMKAGVSLEASGSDGQTPLHHAIGLQNDAVALHLIAHGARVDVPDGKGRTPMSIAASACRSDVVASLMARGAVRDSDPGNVNSPLAALRWINPLTDGCRATAMQLLESPLAARVPGRRGGTLLHTLCADAALCERVLRIQPDADARDADGQTPLHALAATGRGGADSVKLLVSAGADINARTLRDGRTALHIVADDPSGAGRIEFVRALVAQGARSDIRDAAGRDVATILETRRRPFNAGTIDEFTRVLAPPAAASPVRTTRPQR